MNPECRGASSAAHLARAPLSMAVPPGVGGI